MYHIEIAEFELRRSSYNHHILVVYHQSVYSYAESTVRETWCFEWFSYIVKRTTVLMTADQVNAILSSCGVFIVRVFLLISLKKAVYSGQGGTKYYFN